MLRRTFILSLSPCFLDLFRIPSAFSQPMQEKPVQKKQRPSYRIVDLGVVGRPGTPDLSTLWRQRWKARAAALERLNKPAHRIPIDAGTPAPIATDWPITLDDVNDYGAAVGYVLYAAGSNDIEVQVAVLWKDGKPIMLEGFGGSREQAYSINNHGQIVGTAGGGTGESRPCLWLNQKPHDLNLLIPPRSGWKLNDTQFLLDNEGRIMLQGQFKGQQHVARLIPSA